MEQILKFFETLSKYGVFDIVFGIGIFTLLSKLLKSKTVSDIEGVDLIPEINFQKAEFTLMVKNQSPEPLYLYKAYIEPGYNTERIDKSSFSSFLRTLIFKTWKNDRFPRVHGHAKTTKGLYILQALHKHSNSAPTLFIEPYQHDSYFLNLDPNELQNDNDYEDIFEKKQFGVLKINFVQGTKSGQLEVQI